jgi:hypothetical protein
MSLSRKIMLVHYNKKALRAPLSPSGRATCMENRRFMPEHPLHTLLRRKRKQKNLVFVVFSLTKTA